MNLTPPRDQVPAPDTADNRSQSSTAPTGTPAPATEKPPLLLIAEDDLPFRKWLSEALLNLGFRVTLAADGVQAVTAAVQVQPDVILMDLGLPAMDGLQATAAIKRDPRTRHIPVIALTAYSGGTRERARAAGCDAFVAKPFTAEHVAIQTRLVLAERRLNEAGRPQRAEL